MLDLCRPLKNFKPGSWVANEAFLSTVRIEKVFLPEYMVNYLGIIDASAPFYTQFVADA